MNLNTTQSARRNDAPCLLSGAMWALGVAVGGLIALGAAAQSTVQPGAGDISRDIRALPLRPEVGAAPLSIEKSLPEALPGEAQLLVTGFQFTGATQVSEEALRALMQPYVGQSLTLKQLEVAVQRVTELYRERGWLASVYLPPQEISAGMVGVMVLEGRLSDINVTGGGDEANVAFVGRVVSSGVRKGEVISLFKLERNLLIANDIPGVVATGVLKPGDKPGELSIDVQVDEKAALSSNGELRNFGGRATGEWQLTAGFDYSLHRGYGERINVTGLVSEGTRSIGVGGSAQIGVEGWRLGLQASHLSYRLLREFSVLNAVGDSNILGVTLNYPLLRSETKNLRFGLGVTHKSYQDYALDTQIRRRKLMVYTATLDGDRRDAWAGGGVNWGGIAFTLGSVDLRGLAADVAADRAGPNVEGAFLKAALWAGRVQNIDPKTSLVVSFSGQWSSQNLDSSERLSLGGPQGIRGYPVGEVAADRGYLLKLEIERNFEQSWRGFAFIDVGEAQVNGDPWLGSQAINSYSLQAAGVGIRWSNSSGWRLEGAVASPLGSSGAASQAGLNQDGSKRGPRAWVRLSRSM